jgi:hypothetical protein
LQHDLGVRGTVSDQIPARSLNMTVPDSPYLPWNPSPSRWRYNAVSRIRQILPLTAHHGHTRCTQEPEET